MMADRWVEQDLKNSRYVWLPLWVQDVPDSDMVLSMSEDHLMVWVNVVVGWFDKWSFQDLQRFPGVQSSSRLGGA